MILDWENDGKRASRYEILDAASGEPLPTSPPWDAVVYADDEAGVIRLYPKDDRGNFVWEVDKGGGWVRTASADLYRKIAPNGDDVSPPLRLAVEEVRRPIRIVPKGGNWSTA